MKPLSLKISDETSLTHHIPNVFGFSLLFQESHKRNECSYKDEIILKEHMSHGCDLINKLIAT